MKNVILCLFILNSIILNSQINYSIIDSVINLDQIMGSSDVDTIEIDFDLNGQNDMRISSWTHPGDTVVDVLMIGGLGKLNKISSCSYLLACESSEFANEDIGGFIYTSNCMPNPYANLHIKIPFMFQGFSGNHYAFLYVNYQSTTITIEGYSWNGNPNDAFTCEESGWLEINKLNKDDYNTPLKYYNLLGQEVNEPHGLTIILYENGVNKKVYFE